MSWAPDDFTGKRLGRYELLCRLAVGGMAEIFLGFTKVGLTAGRPVVLKKVLSEQQDDPTALKMLLDEARLTAQLSHPHVAQVLDIEMVEHDVVLVIEFIAGATLEEVAQTAERRDETVPLGLVLAAVRDAALGLQHAHQLRDGRGVARAVVHRDVTPRNIMMAFAGTATVLDFGIARAMGSRRRTQAGMVRGTSGYMSPEQATGETVDPRSDLFSLGVVFHELLVGQRLFARPSPLQEMQAVYEGVISPPSKVSRRVPKALDAVVMRALCRNVNERYGSASEFLRDLQLAAGSTCWSAERCAEMMRSRFAERHQDLQLLLDRVPNLDNDQRTGRVFLVSPPLGENERTQVGVAVTSEIPATVVFAPPQPVPLPLPFELSSPTQPGALAPVASRLARTRHSRSKRNCSSMLVGTWPLVAAVGP